MNQDHPLIERKAGIVAFVLLLGFFLSAFFSLANRAESLFETGGKEPDGLTLAPSEIPMFIFDLSGWAAILLLTFIPTFVLWRKKGSYRRIWVIVSFIVVYILLAAIEFGIIYENQNFWELEPFLLIAGYAIVLLMLSVLVVVFTLPLVPSGLGDARIEHVSRYIGKQWKFTQAIITVSLSLAIGASIPMALNILDSPGYLAVFSVLTTILLPFFTAAGFFTYRIHKIEVEKRD